MEWHLNSWVSAHEETKFSWLHTSKHLSLLAVIIYEGYSEVIDDVSETHVYNNAK